MRGEGRLAECQQRIGFRRYLALDSSTVQELGIDEADRGGAFTLLLYLLGPSLMTGD